MGRRAWMDREAARVADIGEMIKELQPVDEAKRRLFAADRFEADKAAVSVLEVFVCALAVEAGLQAGVDDSRDLRMRGEEGRDLGGVGEMALDAQGQRFEALKQLKRVLWRKAGAEVAQQRGAGAEHVGDRAEELRQLKVVAVSVARVRPVDQRLALRKVDPWELAAVDDGAADRRSVAADVFGRRIDHDRRAVIERPDGERARRCCR